ncbi:MAG TPA: MMPL family transporter [Minicystis sp.]|nr:MMPL family transporter [Minicystis sp.]
MLQPHDELQRDSGVDRRVSSVRLSDRRGPASGRGRRLLEWLVGQQVDHPFRVLLLGVAVTAVSLLFASRLTLRTGFEYLLPDKRPSVVELHRVAAKTAGVSTLFIVLEAPPGRTKPLREAADALVPKLQQLGSPWVGSVEDGVFESYQFLAPRAGLFADLDKLVKLREQVDARYNYEVAKRLGTDLGDEPPPALDAKRIEKDFGIEGVDASRFPDGYYQSKDGRTVVVAIRSKVLGTDVTQGTEALRRVRQVIADTHLERFDPSITYGFAGDLYSGIAEVSAINRDLTEVGLWGAALILGIVLLYYLRVRTLVAMLATVVVGVSWTFGVAELAIGHLNMATGFMFTIVAGNGLNAGVIYMARYLEARRNGEDLRSAISTAHEGTWLATLTAAVAASAAYGSLLLTEFRGFRDFGLIGCVGMLLCWLGTYLTTPALLAAMERVLPLHKDFAFMTRLRAWWGSAFGRPVAELVRRAPRVIAISGLAFAAFGVIAAVHYVRSDPMEYDLNNLRNERKTRADEERYKHLADEITGYVGADGMAILVDRPEQVKPLRDALYARRDAAPADLKPFKALHALEDFVPEQQAEKIPVLLALKKRIVRAHELGILKGADWDKLKDLLPPDDIKPFTMADLPVGVARTFTESDGTRGRIVYISPTSGELVEDAHYLLRWADSYRETHLADGSTVVGSGRAVIYADMWEAVVAAVPHAVLFSFLATLIVVAIAFRGARPALLVMGSLLVGVAWLVALLVLFGIKINFLNFIALPITFGIGVDYAVNVVHRYEREGADGALIAVRETGGAVILCSLTTTLGYLALVKSMNFAVRSLGMAAVLGEVCCLVAAVLVLPAALLWLRSRGRDSLGRRADSVGDAEPHSQPYSA